MGGVDPINDLFKRRLALALLAAAGTCIAPASALAGGLVSIEREGGGAAKQAIERYWTPERMRAARPLEAVVEDGELETRRGPKQPLNHPAPFESGQVTDPAVFPNSVNGRLFGRLKVVGGYSCSGTVVDAPSHSVVMSAGHCVAERGFGTATKLAFVPAYERGARPFGTWVFDRIVAQKAWRKRSNFNYDFSAISMSRQNGTAVQDVAGGVPLAVKLPVDQTYVATGYPSNRVNGEVMWRCTGQFAGFDPDPIPNGPKPIAIGCDMGEGASGGGWQVNGALNSVSSFGYNGHPDVLYGPYFGGKAAQVYNAVANG